MKEMKKLSTKYGVEAIIFRKLGNEKKFLILHRILNWQGWEFVKGGIDENESTEQAILREIEEETGLKKIKIISKLPNKKIWEAKGIKYIYDVFIVEADAKEKVKLQQKIVEHDNYKWCFADDVLKLLTYENSKEIFKKALKVIE